MISHIHVRIQVISDTRQCLDHLEYDLVCLSSIIKSGYFLCLLKLDCTAQACSVVLAD